MTNEFKKTSSTKDQTVYTLESATAGGTSSGSIASVSSPMGSVQKRGQIVTSGTEKKVPATTPRNFVAKNATTGGAGAHKDKKKAEKQGTAKHKKPYMESLRAQIDQLKSRLAESTICPYCNEDPCGCDDSHGFVAEDERSSEYGKAGMTRHWGNRDPKNAELSHAEMAAKHRAYAQQMRAVGQHGLAARAEVMAKEHDTLAQQEPMEGWKEKVAAGVLGAAALGAGVAGHHTNKANAGKYAEPEQVQQRQTVKPLNFSNNPYSNDTVPDLNDPTNDRMKLKNIKEQGVAEGSEIKIPTEDGITMQDIRLMAGEGPLTKKTVRQAIEIIRKQRRPQGVAEAEKNPHTSALGKALYRDLSKEKKASPAQVEKNKARWAQRQADKEQGVAEDGYDPSKPANYTLGHAPDAEYVYSIYRDGEKEGTYHSIDQVKRIVANMKKNSPHTEYKVKRSPRNKMAGPVGQLPESGVAEGDKDEPFDYKKWKSPESNVTPRRPRGYKDAEALNKQQAEYNRKKKEQGVDEGAKVDRQAAHITKSMMQKGKSKKDVEGIAWAHIKHPKNESVDPYFESLQQMVERQLEPTMDLDTWDQNFQNADPQKYHQFKNKTAEKKK